WGPGRPVPPCPGAAPGGMAGTLECSRYGPDSPRPRLGALQGRVAVEAVASAFAWGEHGQRRRRTAARAATPAAGAGGDPSRLRRDGRPHGLPVRADEARGAGAVAAAPAAAGATGGRLVTPRHPGTCPLVVVGGRADAAVPRRRPVRLAPLGRR